MNQAEMEAMTEFHNHELMKDAEADATRTWLAWVHNVERKLGHHLDGDQDQDGYSLDQAHDFYSDGLLPDEAAAEFTALKKAAR